MEIKRKMKLYDLKETSEKTGMSRATIYRFYEKNPELWSETNLKIKKRLIPETHLSSITKTNIYAKALVLDQQTQDLRRLVNLLSEADSNECKLYQMPWDWTGKISIRGDVTEGYCIDKMQQAFKYLVKLYGSAIGLRIFFTLEPFMSKTGPHIHFNLRVDRNFLTNRIIEELKEFFKDHRIEIKKYDPYTADIYHLLKDGEKGKDWDILGVELSKKGGKK